MDEDSAQSGAHDVAVLIPDGRERFALAVAFAPNRLHSLITTLWTPPDRAPWRWMGVEKAGRRWRAEIPADRVKSFAGPELRRLLAHRFLSDGAARARLIDTRNQRFDAFALRTLIRAETPPRHVVAHPSCCLETLRWAREAGIETTVVLPLAHPRTVRCIERELRERDPAAARTWDLADRSPALEARIEQELEIADRIVCPSEFVRESCIEQGLPADKLHVVPYGADVARYAGDATAPPADEARPLRFITAGFLSQRKGIATLLDAFAQLPDGSATLDLVGAWHGGTPLRDPLPPGVTHHGFLRGDDFVRALRSADLFVLPSLCEGSALVTYEAIAAGLPLIVTREAGSRVEDDVNGCIVSPAGDAAALTAALHRALDPDTRNRWIAAARAPARRAAWSWDRYGESMRALVT